MRRGTSALEYMAILAILALAFIAMQNYIVRGFCGRYKDAADTFGFGRQYEPGVTVVQD